MCSGKITRYSCGHEARTYYDKCPDGLNEEWQELLPHRMIGRRFRCTRLCRDCENQRLQEEFFENDHRQMLEERAKALIEFFRGERTWPRPDDEVRENFAHAYVAGDRLHPWLNRGNEPDLEINREVIERDLGFEGANLFRIMLDRQANIDQTGRPITTDDRNFALGSLHERRRQIIARQNAFAYAMGQRLHPWRGEEPALDRFRIWMTESFINAIDPNSTGEAGTRLFQEMLNRQADIDLTGRPVTNEDREFNFDSIVERGCQFQQQFADQRRQVRERAEANEESDPIRPLVIEWVERIERRIRESEQELDQLRGEIADRIKEHISMEEARGRNPFIQQQEAPKVEQPTGLYESDPDWLQNFDDWCTENSITEAPHPEIDLRRDINGWFQHLRTCESQVRLDWIPFAETYRDAIQTGERRHYEYVPIPNALGQEPLSFQNWITANADPAEIPVSSMTYMFIRLLEGYADYLRNNGWSADLEAFQFERQTRVRIMRIALMMIPGAPLSPLSEDEDHIFEDTPSIRGMRDDIRRLCRRGHSTSQVEYLQRQAEIARFESLHSEARDVREGRRTEFRIEREEREARARENRERVMVLLDRQTLNIRGRAAQEAMARQRAEDRAAREVEVAEERHGEPRREAPAREMTRYVRFIELLRHVRRRPRPSPRLLANRNRRWTV